MKNKLIYIIVVIILVAGGGAGYYIYQDFFVKFVKHPMSNIFNDGNEVEDNSAVTCDVNATSTECANPVIISNVEELNIPAPDLNRPIVVTATDLSGTAKQIAVENIKTLIEKLKKDAVSFDDWLNLGAHRKLIGDYEGAIEVWEYVSKVSPTSSTSFSNLADLYAYYIKDNTKAEQNFLKAIEISPDKIYLYSNAYDFYTNVLKDKEKAKAILEKGIKLNPKTSSDLKYLLNNTNL